MKDLVTVAVSFPDFLASLDLLICHFRGEITESREFILSVNVELALDNYRRDPDNLAPIFAIIPALAMANNGQIWNPN